MVVKIRVQVVPSDYFKPAFVTLKFRASNGED